MSAEPVSSLADDWRILALGREDRLSSWLDSRDLRRATRCALVVAGGAGLYGATIGLWHGPRMAAYVGVKLPLVVFLTLAVNGILNGLLARILGSGLGFRQTAAAQLMAFAIFALIVGSLSPLTGFLTWNAPPPDGPLGAITHRRLLVIHTGLIAFAGVVAVRRLHGIVAAFSGSGAAARCTLTAWMAGNLFAGAQLGFLLRPIFGTPRVGVAFLRPDAFDGNFYESLWWALRHCLMP